MTELQAPLLARPVGSRLRLDLVAAAVGRRAGAIVPLLVLVVGWEAASRSGIVTPFLLPRQGTASVVRCAATPPTLDLRGSGSLGTPAKKGMATPPSKTPSGRRK